MPGGRGGLLAGEPARSVLEADGTVSVYTQQMPHGQGHETTLAQVAADELGVPIEQVRVRYGDTSHHAVRDLGHRRQPVGADGRAARSRTRRATLREQHRSTSPPTCSRHRRRTSSIEDGDIHVAGVPSISVTFADVAAACARPGEPAARRALDWDGGEGGWAQATHVCWVEVDLETGRCTIHRYVVVEDCGELINPAIVDGQIRGGVAQGIGAVLYEKSTYDDDGATSRPGTFMDYLIPTAMEMPEIEIHHVETPTDIEINYRGVGEGGMIGAPAAITNAIEDALARPRRAHHRTAPPARRGSSSSRA